MWCWPVFLGYPGETQLGDRTASCCVHHVTMTDRDTSALSSALGQGLPYSPKRSLPEQGSCFVACCTGLSLWVVPGMMKLVACFSTEMDAFFFFLDVCWPSERHGDGTSCIPSIKE